MTDTASAQIDTGGPNDTRTAPRGTLTVAERVAQRLAIKAALDTPHVQRHSRGLSKIGGLSLPHARLDITANQIRADLQIAVTWPVPVPDVARAVQRNVIHALHTLGGFDVIAVDVTITVLSSPTDLPARVQ